MGVPAAPAAAIAIGTTSGASLAAGDNWPTNVGFLSLFPNAASGRYTATLTFTVIGRVIAALLAVALLTPAPAGVRRRAAGRVALRDTVPCAPRRARDDAGGGLQRRAKVDPRHGGADTSSTSAAARLCVARARRAG